MNTLTRLLLSVSLILPLGAVAAGAIALGEGQTDSAYGFVTSARSDDQAASDALRACDGSSGKGCKVVMRFEQCGAYAASSKDSGIGYGSSIDMAKAMALYDCGTYACKVVAAKCE